MRIVLVDDEPLALRRLELSASGLSGVEIVGIAANGRDALSVIERTRPDLVVLDVELPLIDGVEVAFRLHRGAAPIVIFITGHDEYRDEAQNVGAFDFLLKPVRTDRLESSLRRAMSVLKAEQPAPREPGGRAQGRDPVWST